MATGNATARDPIERRVKVLLDSNVWRYFADHADAAELEEAAIECRAEIVVAPALVFEARGLRDDTTRKRILSLLGRSRWRRLMPEAFLEAEEIKAVVQRLRPEWLVECPNLEEVTRLRFDWERIDGGFWSRARDDLTLPHTDEALRAAQELALARQESVEIRQRVLARKAPLPTVSLNSVYAPVPGPNRDHSPELVEYWRVPSLHCIRSELSVFTSPYREWLDSELNVAAIAASSESLERLWYNEIKPTDVPRQWVRGAFEFLQAFHKNTPGAPADSQLGSHLVDVDVVVSADRNFVRFARKCRDDAPFSLAEAHLVGGGAKGPADLFALLKGLEFETRQSNECAFDRDG